MCGLGGNLRLTLQQGLCSPPVITLLSSHCRLTFPSSYYWLTLQQGLRPPPVITWKHSRSLVSVRVYERKRESCKTHQVVCIKVRIGQRPLVVKPHTGSCPLRSRRTHAHPGVGSMPPWCTRLIQVLAAFPHGALGFELWNVLSLTRPPHHCINWAGGI